MNPKRLVLTMARVWTRASPEDMTAVAAAIDITLNLVRLCPEEMKSLAQDMENERIAEGSSWQELDDDLGFAARFLQAYSIYKDAKEEER